MEIPGSDALARETDKNKRAMNDFTIMNDSNEPQDQRTREWKELASHETNGKSGASVRCIAW
jgi:hypothetical protein